MAGYSVTSVDPLYHFSTQEITKRVNETYSLVIAPLYNDLEKYVWDRFKDPDSLGRYRLEAMQRFLDGYEEGRNGGRYQAQSAPHLNFADNSFGLALCSHFLFLYTEQLSYELHRDAIIELCRVAGEVRIFPLVDLDCNPSAYLSRIQEDLPKFNLNASVENVPYEFQRGGNHMMKVTRILL